MSGLRERKKQATRLAIRDAAMALFEEQGFAQTTFDRIAEAADVSRATVFSYFPTKEEIVFGDAALAIDALGAMLAERPADRSTIATVRAWLAGLTGWIEPELVLQLRLAHEVPSIGARRLRLHGEIQDAVADAFEAELGPDAHLAARLAAASLIAALGIVEETAAARMEEGGGPLSAAEVDALLEDAVAFAEAGVAAVAARWG
jgi:AcrR family transcriptional regulator